MIKLPWKRGARSLEPKIMVNPRLMELETAKQILEEIFHSRRPRLPEWHLWKAIECNPLFSCQACDLSER